MSEAGAGAVPDVPVWRLNLLRIFYVLIALGMGIGIWGQLLGATPDWPLMRGLAKSMLGGLALLCLLGLLDPLKWLPLLVYEMAWKTVWLIMVALPAWRAGALTPDQLQTFYECIPVVFLYAVMPWRYMRAIYVTAPVARWR
jgi:hypothetical protein